MSHPNVRTRFGLLLAHAVLLQAMAFAMRPTLSYAILEAGASLALLGVVVAAFALPALLLALPVGHIIDRIGERWVLTIGALAITFACLAAVIAAGTTWALMGVMMLLGSGHLLAVIGEQTVVANMANAVTSDSRFGLYTFAGALGQSAGPLLLLIPSDDITSPPVELIFLLCGAIGTLMFVVSLLLPRSHGRRIRDGERSLTTLVATWRMPSMPSALVVSGVVIASIDLFVVYMPALGQERALPTAVIGTILAAMSIAAMVSRFLLGLLVRTFGRRTVVVSSLAASSLSLAVLAIPSDAIMLICVSAVYGFAIGTCQPITMAWVSDLARPGSEGMAISLRVASNRAGQTVVPLILGGVATMSGAAGVLVAVAIVLGATLWPGTAARLRPRSGSMHPK